MGIIFTVSWDDPAFHIEWPVTEGFIINERDRAYADFGTHPAHGGGAF